MDEGKVAEKDLAVPSGFEPGKYVVITRDQMSGRDMLLGKLVKLLPCQHPGYVNIHRKSIDPHNHANSDGGYNIVIGSVRLPTQKELLDAGLVKPDVIDTYDIY